jgi:hypothetical protein
MDTSPVSGDDGRVDFSAQPGIELHVSADTNDRSVANREVEVAPLAAGETREIVLELITSDDMVFFGRVIDRETHAPVAASVRIDPVAGKRGARTLQTGTDGRFDASLASWSGPRLTVLAEGYAEVVVIPERVHDNAEHAFAIEVARAATLRVHINDANGAVIAAAEVSVRTESERITQPRDAAVLGMLSTSDWTRTRETGADGSVDLNGLPPDVPLMVQAARGRLFLYKELAPIQLKPGEVRELTWRVGGGCTLTGRVTDQDAKAVAQYTMWLVAPDSKRTSYFSGYEGDEARVCRTDDDGRFRFTDVAPGSWWVGPAKYGHSFDPPVAPLAVLVDIAEGETQHDVEIRVDRGLYIRGHVLDPSGRPAGHAYISAWQASSRLYMDTDMVRSEEFAIGPLEHGRYKVAASAHPEYYGSDTVECEAGTVDVVLHLKLGGTLSGTVIDGETNQPIVARVMYSRPGKPDSGWGTTQARPDGTFSFGGLEPDTYAIVASDTRDRVAIVTQISVGAGEESKGVNIVLVPGSHVRVHYDGAEPYGQLSIRSGGATVAGDGLEKGTMRDFSIPKGAVTLVMHLVDADRTFERKLDFAAGETKDVTFTEDWR